MISRAVKFTVPWVLIGCMACSSDPTSPEQRIQELNSEAEAAAESKDVSTLKDMVAEDFKHDYLDKSSVIRLVQMHMFRHKSIHIFSLTKSLQIVDEDTASAEILVAMAGEPVEHANQLFDLRADLLRFDVAYGRFDDEWKVVGVSWKRAQVEDFL